MSTLFRSFFDVHQPLLTLWSYKMSGLEFTATLLSLASVWLAVRKNIWTWPVGTVGGLLLVALFFQIRLYSDLIEQLYYLLTNCYGWWLWGRLGKRGESRAVRRLSARARALNATALIVASLGLGSFMVRAHTLVPAIFPEAAAFPYWDAVSTVLSFFAQILMAQKRIECWTLWIVGDVICIMLYWAQGVVLLAVLFALFLLLAVRGHIEWHRASKTCAAV